MKYIKENYINFYGKTPDASSYGEPVKVVQMIPDALSSGSVLDLGAGDGRNAIYLAEHRFDVTAVDLSEAGLEKLKRLANTRGVSVHTAQHDLSSWSIDRDYDAVLAIVILQHLQEADALRVLDEMKGRTKIGGVNAVTLFTKNGERYAIDQTEDPGSFYADEGWIKGFYEGWEVLHYGVKSAPLIGRFHKDGTPVTNMIETILVRKSE